MGEDDRESIASEQDRYRALMEISSAIASQPNLQAALQSLRNLLSKVVAFDSVALLLLDDRKHTLRLIALGHGPDTPRVDMGIEAPYIQGTAIDRALTERKPVFIQDIQEELRKTPELVARIPVDIPQSSCVFPVLTSRKVLGVLVFSSAKADEFGPDDLELMSSVSSHVAVALESALAFDAAEEYERELGRERDRLKLLLKINNHIVTKLDIHELFHSAAASIREYFGNDFSGR